MPPSLLMTAAPTTTRAAQSAARFIAAKPLKTKDIDKSILPGNEIDSAERQ